MGIAGGFTIGDGVLGCSVALVIKLQSAMVHSLTVGVGCGDVGDVGDVLVV